MITRKEIYRLYSHTDWKTKLYLRIKLRICPLLSVETYVPARGRVVDLGCGSGLFSFILKLGSPLREISGLDYDANKLRLAEKIQLAGAMCRFFHADLTKSSFPPADVYTLIDVLYLIPFDQQLAVLRRCYELLSPGGYIIIKEMDTRPRWKYFWNYFQESVAVKIVGFTRGKKFHFRQAVEWESILKSFNCQTTLVRLDKGYWYPHLLIIGQKSLID